METKAVVYTSNTGTTREYAEIIGRHYDLPVYNMDEALKQLERGDGIIYLGWIMSGEIQGYERAGNWFQILCVLAVGAGATGTQVSELRGANKVEEKLFTLQGGLFMDRLSGGNKAMMKVFAWSVKRRFKGQKNLSADEEALYDLFRNGGSRVSEANLARFYEWMEE